MKSAALARTPRDRPAEPALPGFEEPERAVRFVRVALPVPLGRAFSYTLSEERSVLPGARVVVELGRQKCIGVALETTDAPPPDIPPAKWKPILEILDEEPILPRELMEFLRELARYYLVPIGEVMRLALPVLERKHAAQIEKAHGKRLRAAGRLVQTARARDVPDKELPRLSPQARALLTQLRERGLTPVKNLQETFKSARSIVKRLAELELVELSETALEEEDRFFAEEVPKDEPKVLNDGQAAAKRAITGALEAHQPAAFLLDGVTASGKTEVYLQAASRALELGRGVLILVPEIALTPQLIARFRARLGDDIAAVHSELTDKAKLSMWRGIRQGRLRVVVGARSAIFAPIRDLGLVCVDEEHDPSYKQEERVRYHARDMALLRARKANAVCVLGSATPSLASEALVTRRKLVRLVLPERAHSGAELPQIELIDLKRFGPGPTQSPLISLPLHRAIEQTLSEGGQTILFLNRRGFAPSYICESCGAIATCPDCSVALTLHRASGERLTCHYCGFTRTSLKVCEECGHSTFLLEGAGTEQIESIIAESFPTARVARLDRDVAGGTKSGPVLDRMRKGEVDILVGTQMVTKGHDLPRVTLVGVLNADTALSMPDFRAAERTFQLLVQVAGRAGRHDRPGKVLIQTRTPDHPALLAAKNHDVRAFVRTELDSRLEANFPPFAQLALVRFEGVDEVKVRDESLRMARVAKAQSPLVEIMGPAPAPISRIQNRYRYRFMIRSAERAPLREALLSVVRTPVVSQVRMSVDIDPQNLL